MNRSIIHESSTDQSSMNPFETSTWRNLHPEACNSGRFGNGTPQPTIWEGAQCKPTPCGYAGSSPRALGPDRIMWIYWELSTEPSDRTGCGYTGSSPRARRPIGGRLTSCSLPYGRLGCAVTKAARIARYPSAKCSVCSECLARTREKANAQVDSSNASQHVTVSDNQWVNHE